MKRGLTIFLQVVVVLISIGALAFMLWEPHLEGRNVNATLFEIYFKDPFLAYVYVASIPFFIALYQAFKVLGNIGRNEMFTERSVQAVRTIKYCALITVGAIVAADAFLVMAARSSNDDPAGAIALSIAVAFVLIVVATAAGVFGRILQNGLNMKLENER